MWTCAAVSTRSMIQERHTYHREGDGAICDEVVIEARQVCATAVQKLNRRLHVETERMSALNYAHDLLLRLL